MNTGADLDEIVRAVRAAVYERRRTAERSLMAKGVFAAAARESAVREPS